MGNYTIQRNQIVESLSTNGVLFEGLSYDSSSGLLTWVDILSDKVYLKSLSDSHPLSQSIDLGLPSATLLDGDEIVIAANNHVYWFSLEGMNLQGTAKIPSTNPALVTNEMKRDPQGNLWVGMMDRSGSSPGELWILSQEGEFQLFSENVGIPNTLLWDLDRDRFYYGDSAAGEIYVQSISKEKTKRTPFVFFPLQSKALGIPDGSELLPESGAILNCRWDGSSILEISTRGEIANVWNLPWKRPTDIVRVSHHRFAVSTADHLPQIPLRQARGAVVEIALTY